MSIKVGDRIRCLDSHNGAGVEEAPKVGEIYTVKCVKNENVYVNDGSDGRGQKCNCGNHSSWVLYPQHYEIIETSMNLLQKFRLSMKGEPEKTFIKAGIIDSDEKFTTEGKELFNAFLLKKFGDDFKKEVVDPLIAEEPKTE